LDSKPRRVLVFARGCLRNLVETALGAVLVAVLVLAALILPCALIDVATGTNLLGPVAVVLLLVLAAAAILGAVAIYQKRYSDDKKGTADNKGTVDRHSRNDWRKR
jgi:membrane protein implicated in regulation of membrane protease activity